MKACLVLGVGSVDCWSLSEPSENCEYGIIKHLDIMEGLLKDPNKEYRQYLLELHGKYLKMY